MTPSTRSASSAPRPSKLTYNDLNGSEMKGMIMEWFERLISSHPLLQPHLTLPNVKMTLQLKVGFDMYTGGTVPFVSAPEHDELNARVVFEHELSEAAASLRDETSLRIAAELAADELERQRELEAVVNAAPVEGGRPPDAIRIQHGMPVPRPSFGPRDQGSHMFLADVPQKPPAAPRQPLTDPIMRPGDAPAPSIDPSGGRRGEVAQGYTFASEVVNASPVEQHMPADNGEIAVDLAGRGIHHESGMTVKSPTHRMSVKVLGDSKGPEYGGVNGVYDPGPRGLMSPGRGAGGYGTDGRPRLSFGNDHRGR